MSGLRYPLFKIEIGILALLLIALLYMPSSVTTIRAQTAQTVNPTPIATPLSHLIPISDDVVNAVSRNLYCPVCENTPLEVCPTDACVRWREQVRELLAQGESEDQVRQYFIDHFGMRTVGTPTDTASVLLTTGLPFGLISIAGILIIWQLWRWYRNRPKLGISIDSDLNNTDIVDDYQSRIEAELRKKG